MSNEGRNKRDKFNQSNADYIEKISNTTAFEGNIQAFTVISDCVLGAGCLDIDGNVMGLTSDSFATGQVIIFPASQIQLASGTIYAHYDKH